MKKPYERPRVLYTEKIEGRAVACVCGNDAQCGAGPIQS